MRFRDVSIDDIDLELLLTIDEPGGQRWTKPMRSAVNCTYRIHHGSLLLLVRVCYWFRDRR
jgi:hypothetical protein